MSTNLQQQSTDADLEYLKKFEEYRLPSWARAFAGGSLWAWSNVNNSPVQVGALTNWTKVYAGDISSPPSAPPSGLRGITNQGGLFVTGGNGIGQLGLSDTTSRSSPTQVGGTWASFDGSASSLAIRSDGTLWAWGANGEGYLGLNDTTNRSSPVQVGNSTGWAQVSSGLSTFAIRTNGTLWAWGDNGASVYLGLGADTTPRSSPTQVGSLTNWRSVSVSQSAPNHVLAIKTDGTLWAWGDNSAGQLGLGDRTHRSSPVQVGTLTNWSTVCATMGPTSVATKADGTLWAWGNGTSQPLGLGDNTSRSSPTQVGSLTNWEKVDGRQGLKTLAIKTDGTLWTWGRAIGDMPTFNTDLLSPTQVGTATNWIDIASTTDGGFAIRA
jgi:alpha-tubulin suppressor-like RCC1 family protein